LRFLELFHPYVSVGFEFDELEGAFVALIEVHHCLERPLLVGIEVAQGVVRDHFTLGTSLGSMLRVQGVLTAPHF
jgi:hypothetical protein